MLHLNGNLLAAIDTETTGIDPTTHEIIEIAIIPLTHALKPHPNIIPFSLKLKPDKPENIDYAAMSCNKAELMQLLLNGVAQATAADMLDRWFASIGLGENKRLVPVGHNYTSFDRLFINEWIGKANYAHIFDFHDRDTFIIAQYLNDRSWFVNEKPPFPKQGLSYVASQLGIKNPAPHTALGDAWTAGEIYRKIMGRLPVAMGENK